MPDVGAAGSISSPLLTSLLVRRMYATAAARGDGLLLLCGGRDAGGTPMGDAYGFARHRDGRWEWHAAPGAMPTGRYQHGAIFVGNRLHISGGAVGGGRMVGAMHGCKEGCCMRMPDDHCSGSNSSWGVQNLTANQQIRHAGLSGQGGLMTAPAMQASATSEFHQGITRRGLCFEPSPCHVATQVDENTSTVVLDTNAGQWVSPVSGASGEDFTRRCR